MKKNLLKKIKVEKEAKKGFVRERLIQFGLMKERELFELLETKIDGITQKEAEERIEEYGYNEISYGNGITLRKRLFDAFINPYLL